MTYLPEMELVKLIQNQESDFETQFVIEPLLPGFGMTLGNTLRRVLLSSLKGAAITAVKINNSTHEFTAVDGVTEDVVALILNLKGVWIRYESDEPSTITLDVKGPQVVTAADFKLPAGVEIINPDHIIAHVDKGKKITIEARVETGKGYLPTEQRKGEILPSGMIAIDAVFTPIRKIHHEITNTRVGQKTDFDKLTITVSTDGSISAVQAFKNGLDIIQEYFALVNSQIQTTEKTIKVKKAKKTSKKTEENIETGE